MHLDISPIDQTMAILAKQELIYILGEDPRGLIAKKFPAHPDYAFVVEWLFTGSDGVLSLWLTDTGQLYDGFIEKTALFDTFEEAKAAADEFQCKLGAGTTIVLKFEVGTLAPPKAAWRGK